jgi:hypothetical protein
MRFTPDTLQALIKGQVGKEFSPLPSVPHIRETEGLVSHILEPCESALEELRYSVRGRAPISSAEIEIALIPLGIDVDNVVERSILRWRFNMLWFQYGLDQMISFFLNVDLGAFWHPVLELSSGTRSPGLFCHRIESLCERISRVVIPRPTQTSSGSPFFGRSGGTPWACCFLCNINK